MKFFRIFEHLLPRGRAWSLTINKRLRQFFNGLTGIGDDVKSFLDAIWGDIFPETTRELDAWEQEFNLNKNSNLTESERRDRLTAAWRAVGGQNPRYLQDTLQAHGFDVYVHEWWVPGSEPPLGTEFCVTPRNPFNYLQSKTGPVSRMDCGETLAECGEPFAECGNSLFSPQGYPLVNKIWQSVQVGRMLCGETIAECGEPLAQCGEYTLEEALKVYELPTDPAKWPYFVYVGGQNFPDLATIDNSRRDEFEELCLKIFPTHLWIGVLVNYN